eukprot:138611-Rhodomonas_salina.2
MAPTPRAAQGQVQTKKRSSPARAGNLIYPIDARSISNIACQKRLMLGRFLASHATHHRPAES